MKTSEKDYQRAQQYIKENYQWVNVLFKKNDQTDMMILNWLNKVAPARKGPNKDGGAESRVSYIKRLILEDMKRKNG